MRIGRSIAAVSGSAAGSLVGLFLMVSPWISGIDNGHGSWSLATKTDFWSGLGIVVVGLAGIMMYRAGLSRELEAAGVVSRRVQLEEPAPPVPAAEPSPMTDEALLALATSVVNDMHQQQGQPVHPVTAEGASAPAGAPMSDAELVRLASSLLKEIQSEEPAAPAAPAVPSEAPAGEPNPQPALMSEQELVKMATSLLEEIQRSREMEPVHKGDERHE